MSNLLISVASTYHDNKLVSVARMQTTRVLESIYPGLQFIPETFIYLFFALNAQNGKPKTCSQCFNDNTISFHSFPYLQETKNCGAPCHELFFKENERTILRYWVGSWAAICCASCLFTVKLRTYKYIGNDTHK